LARLQFVSREQRHISPAIGIGENGFQQSAFAVETPKLDLDPVGRTAVGGVENVRAEFCVHDHLNHEWTRINTNEETGAPSMARLGRRG
jgi:hypothetical protein